MTSHTVRWDALIASLIFAGISAAWLVDHFEWFDIRFALNLTYVLPVLLIIGGLLGIAATLRKPRKNALSNDNTPGDHNE